MQTSKQQNISARYSQQLRARRHKRLAKKTGLISLAVLMVLGLAFLVAQLIILVSPNSKDTGYFSPEHNVIENPEIVGVLTGKEQDTDQVPAGPVLQPDGDITITALDVSSIALLPNGRVDTSYFDNAVFVGDSLTKGLPLYTGNKLSETTKYLCDEGINPLTFMNNQWELVDGVSTSPMQDLANSNAGKIYIMLGLNGMAAGQKDDVILKYYAQIIDETLVLFPDAEIYIQSILPVGEKATNETPEIYSVERIVGLNTQLADMAYQHGVNFLNIYEVIADEKGYMQQTVVGEDGIHMTKEGYERWVDYVITHTAHNSNNPYILGSPYYVEKDPS